MPATVGVYVRLPPNRSVPPDEALYQSTVLPAATVAFSAGIVPVAQYDLSPPLTGGTITGHEQFGAETSRMLVHPPASVTVTTAFTPANTPEMVQMLVPVLTTVPVVLVTVPELTVTANE